MSKALGAKQNVSLSTCAQHPASTLQACGPAPDISGISSWLNTPNKSAISLSSLKGKVVLVDFWAYSCINCQRAIPHVESWYSTYRSAGFEVIGIHTPEYAFEHLASNVAAGAERLGITYPVALDNDYFTWNNFSNESWPADYLIDSTGTIRHVSIGEGDYGQTESFIRQLLTAANPNVDLPPSTKVADTTPTSRQTAEIYLGAERAQNYGGAESIGLGTHTVSFPTSLPADEFALSGTTTVGNDGLTAVRDFTIRLNFQAHDVYLDVGGEGTVTATVDGRTRTFAVSGAPNIYPVVVQNESERHTLDVTLTPGLTAYSFTFG